jgi:DNA-binding LacI/PurR family transcriptional regulator
MGGGDGRIHILFETNVCLVKVVEIFFLGSYGALQVGIGMRPFRLLSAPEQVSGYLRGEIMEGRRSGAMPGVHRLANEFGVHRTTAEDALRLLEGEGLLLPQGAGRRRTIVIPGGGEAVRPLRVAILLGEDSDRKRGYMVQLQHELAVLGHAAFFSEVTLLKLGMDVARIKRLVAKTAADAWVVCSGSREVLEWFSTQSTPALSLFGRTRRLPIACAATEKAPAYAAATRELIRLGHRRIVLMTRAQRRLPLPGAIEQAFLDELAAHRLTVSNYNLPDWKETIEGFHARLEALFRVSPPTAMIVDEVPFFIAAQQFLSRKRLRVPEEVSLVCPDQDVAFDWCLPPVSHIRWDSDPLVRRVVRWVTNVSRGKRDVRQFFTAAEFVAGGTIGPVCES